ncbi:PREDICTED: interleukin-18 receptor accessory protein isoform X1 [Dipodomys ordii]|uniref:Interleukin-18 receptor accessory protein isoform X1 n=2 Tax=Dipodomys ordii TaxID=10020 RepID=A0A1S3FF90_DIPOR|nr:PREDICTED: interleukin-18 receptor accessory protein isoform X1 [Dipodomys ordii]
MISPFLVLEMKKTPRKELQISIYSPLATEAMTETRNKGERPMLCLSWMFLWLTTGARITGFDLSDCSTQKLLWKYSAKSEEFVLFCDLTQLQKSHFSHRHQRNPEQPFCNGSSDPVDIQWYLQYQNGGTLEKITNQYSHIAIQDKNMLRILNPETNNTGSYICRARMRSPQDVACCVKITVEVKPQIIRHCKDTVQQMQYLILGTTDNIYCPSLNCQSQDAQRPEVTWYRNGKLLSEEKKNWIKVKETFVYHQGMYVCDYTQSDNTSSWTVRAVVQVRTIVEDTKKKPDIVNPIKNILEVDLGKPFVLPCKVRFGFQRDFRPIIRWYSRNSTQEWEIPLCEEKRIQLAPKEEEIEGVICLKEVKKKHLSRKFVCFAQNSIGNITKTIQLTEKKGVVFVYILLVTIITLVGLLVASALLYIYWIEIVLLCRTYQNKDETLGDKKEFDAFVSYAKLNSLENEASSDLSEEHLALNLFPEVLENKYGYTLCLLERDVAPGGVYTEDIVSIIKKSRRGIFILSPNYINGPTTFELQAAVNLALDDQTLKLILIKFCSFQEPESLPYLVKKALRVLPTVTWRGLKSVRPNSRFWTQMHYHMPVKKRKSQAEPAQNSFTGVSSGKAWVNQEPRRGAPIPGNGDPVGIPFLPSS